MFGENTFLGGKVSCYSHTASLLAWVVLQRAPETRAVSWERGPWCRNGVGTREEENQHGLLSWTLLGSLLFDLPGRKAILRSF